MRSRKSKPARLARTRSGSRDNANLCELASRGNRRHRVELPDADIIKSDVINDGGVEHVELADENRGETDDDVH